MHEQDATEATDAESFAHQKEAVVAQRLAVTRQLILLQQADTTGILLWGTLLPLSTAPLSLPAYKFSRLHHPLVFVRLPISLPASKH